MLFFLTFIYLFIFWSWETRSRTNIGKNMFEQTAERTGKSQPIKTEQENQISASGRVNTFVWAMKLYKRLHGGAAGANTTRELHLHRCEGVGGRGRGLRYFNYAGRKRSDRKQTLEDVRNAHASPAPPGSQFGNTCVIYCLYSCNPLQNTQEIYM